MDRVKIYVLDGIGINIGKKYRQKYRFYEGNRLKKND